MPLNLIWITNRPEIALIAEENGVQRIMVDMETLGKDERQKNMNSVKSHHTVEDAAAVASVLTKSKLLVRINPWHENSIAEIEAVIAAGADSIMLPMWKHAEEVDRFLTAVNGRVHTTLLLETKEAEACLGTVLEHPLLEDIHIGLNDLHLSYGLTFMFDCFPMVRLSGFAGCAKQRAFPMASEVLPGWVMAWCRQNTLLWSIIALVRQPQFCLARSAMWRKWGMWQIFGGCSRKK